MRNAVALFGLAFCVAVLAASPAHFWLDSGELAAAGAELGVTHPPGVPGFVPLSHLCAAIPIGPIGWRLTLLSALCAAGAIHLMGELLRARAVHPALVWTMSAWVLAGTTFVRHARVVEIYALGAFLLMVVLWGFDPRAPSARRTARRLVGVFAAVWGAWGFGDLRLAFALPVALGWGLALHRGRPWAKWAPLVVVAASLALLQLPLASARGPVTDWGDVDSMGRLWAHLQADTIRHAYADQVLPGSGGAWLFHLRELGGQIGEDLGPLGPAVALAGGWLAWRKSGTEDRRALLVVFALAVVGVFYAVGINPMGGRDRQTGLWLGLLAALATGLGLHELTKNNKVARAAALLAAVVTLVAPAAWSSAQDLFRTRSWGPHAWTRAALADVPNGALVLTQSDDLSAGVLAARVLEGARPDIVSIPGQHLWRPATEVSSPAEASLRAAAAGKDEADGIRAALESWEGALAVESPGVVVHAGVELEPNGVPLSLHGGGVEDPLVRAHRLAVDLKADVDRERVVRALQLHARGLVRRGQGGPVAPEARAEAAYRLALSLDEDDPRTLVGLAILAARRGDRARALALAEAAHTADPDEHNAMTHLAALLVDDPARAGEARALAERAVSMRPHLASGWRRLAAVCAQLNDQACVSRAQAELPGG